MCDNSYQHRILSRRTYTINPVWERPLINTNSDPTVNLQIKNIIETKHLNLELSSVSLSAHAGPAAAATIGLLNKMSKQSIFFLSIFLQRL